MAVTPCAHVCDAVVTVRSVLRATALIAVAVLILWAFAAWRGLSWEDLTRYGQARNVLETGGEQIKIPVPEGPDERQLPAIEVTTTGEHEFLFVNAGVPVRYDPCRHVGWVFNPEGAPGDAPALVASAIDDIERMTGLDFVYLGETDETASFDRPLFQERYGPGFAPVIVGFATEDEQPDLAGTVTGVGGSSAVSGAYGDTQYLRSGVVIMDSEGIADILEQRNGAELAEAIIRHELAHVVGLGHVEDRNELMHAENMQVTQWGPGDMQGLAIAGAGPCEPS